MKEKYTLILTSHQAQIITSILVFAKQFFELPSDTLVHNIPTVGPSSRLFAAEAKLLWEEVTNQLQEQDVI